jgi:DNA-binding LytR/AlgR family response regulator
MPMKDLENHFKNYPFERCHRSYFVNTTNIRQVKRSNQKLEIWLNHLDYSLPVSKKYQTLPIWSGY